MSIEAWASDRTLRRPLTSGEHGTCFECGARMVGRIGEILQPHWAHDEETECRFRSESTESYWHRAWKARLKVLGWATEQTRIANGHRHRADAVHPAGTVVEVQHNYQEAREIVERENAYPHMAWLLNGALLSNRAGWGDTDDIFSSTHAPGEWRVGRLTLKDGSAPSLRFMRKPVLLDFVTPGVNRYAEAAGLYYIGNWRPQDGHMSVQALYRGGDANEAAAALDSWCSLIRWAA